MKIANICPTAMLEELINKHETYHLVLVSLVLSDDAYAAFYCDRANNGDTVILDNDAYENGVAFDASMIAEAAYKVNASVVILPDSLKGTALENLDMASRGITALQHMNKPFMAVPHGRTLTEYIHCAHTMSRMPGVTSLGIYKRFEQDIPEGHWSRIDLVRRVFWELPVTLHLLGATSNLREITDPFMRWRVAGMDTCRFVVEGLVNWRMVTVEDAGYRYTGRPENYFKLNDQDNRLAEYSLIQAAANIEYWRKHAA